MTSRAGYCTERQNEPGVHRCILLDPQRVVSLINRKNVVAMDPISTNPMALSRLLPKKILKGPSELNAENLGAQHMK